MGNNSRYKKVIVQDNAYMKDILFDVNGELFSYRVGGALIKDNQILLAEHNGEYALIGGHVQMGETSIETIIREFKEETGLDVEIINAISTYENFWKFDGKNCHQLCIYYRLKLNNDSLQIIPNPDNGNTKFVWVNLSDLTKITLYPLGVAEQIINNTIDCTHFIKKQS